MSRQLLFLMCFPLALLLLNTQAIMLDHVIYKNEFKKLGTYEKFNLSEQELDQEVQALIQYLKGNAPLETKFFNTKEKAHLADVKTLMSIGTWITMFMAGGTFFLYRKLKEPQKSMIKASTITIIGILGVTVLVLTNFSSVFFSFHQIAFTNDFWLLNPATDNLIKMFEEQFFKDITWIIMRNTLISIVILWLAIVYLRKENQMRSCAVS